MMTDRVIYTNSPSAALDALVGELGATSVAILADDNTAQLCLPQLASESAAAASARVLTMRPGDENKTLAAATELWQALSEGGYTRRSLLVCLGGGVVTDMGGFVASTFKRGMPYVNIPTTLLGAVDASIGGKTGVNFGGYKNEVGVFARPAATLAGTLFFGTLPGEQLLSGYGEVLKHALLEGDDALSRALDRDAAACADASFLPLLRESMEVKLRVVASDPLERGPRKALNLGHTAGHAFESLALHRGAPVPHGYAVAWGCVVALVLSKMLRGFPSTWLYRVAAYVKENYGSPAIVCDDYPALLELMAHDKKNACAGQVAFTLLDAPGHPITDCVTPASDITAALDIFRDLVGC